jgi:predicted nucleotidyltransferase
VRAMTPASEPLEHVLASALAASPVGALLRVAILFGSATSGLLHPGSDIDLGILPMGPDLALRRELELQADLERLCGRAVDLVRLDLANTLLRWEVARGGRVLLENPAGAGARFQAQAALEHADLAPLFEAGAERWRRAVLARTRPPG